ncbi:transaldolase [Pyramidobacter piscolens]|uniref:transaldolase n=1 Tax=Pyramidobacter piscolens TaxID=638849 RepID=UPI002492E59E|nr:transaldolase [Pyramidobacter piscolens]
MNDILHQTYALGQSVWYDSISRGAIRGGELKKLLEAGVRGVTTNPAIFQKALAGSADYDADIGALIAAGKSDAEIYDALTLNEVREACALFRPLWDESRGGDGFVSLEVNPLIADDCSSTVSEALRLWKALDCPNAMIKIPATPAGAAALEEAVAAGANVNSTLIFSLEQYAAVAEAYLRALERRAAQGLPLGQASVASVFVSRIDAALDPVLAEKAPELAGRIAIANARAVYARFAELFSSPRWRALAAKGARVQRPLWASTGVKNKVYSPTLYADSLIGRDTVNTLPPAALEAFMKQGTPGATVRTPGFADELAALPALGVDLAAVTEKLLADGLASFAQSFRDMMGIIAAKRAALA